MKFVKAEQMKTVDELEKEIKKLEKLIERAKRENAELKEQLNTCQTELKEATK